MRIVIEWCDDGNTENFDGCSSDCLTIEPDFECQSKYDLNEDEQS